jgi:hypothetical protein
LSICGAELFIIAGNFFHYREVTKKLRRLIPATKNTIPGGKKANRKEEGGGGLSNDQPITVNSVIHHPETIGRKSGKVETWIRF